MSRIRWSSSFSLRIQRADKLKLELQQRPPHSDPTTMRKFKRCKVLAGSLTLRLPTPTLTGAVRPRLRGLTAYVSKVLLGRCCQLKTDNTHYDKRYAYQATRICWLSKQHDSEDHCTDCAYAYPYAIGCTDGECFHRNAQ